MKMSVPLAAVFAVFNIVTQAQASATICSGRACDDRPPPAQAVQPPAYFPSVVAEPSPLVLVPFQDSTGWNYVFSAPRQTQLIVMPYFADSGMFSVSAPDEWTYTVGAPDVDGKITASWQQSPDDTSTSARMFSFRSSFSSSEAIYQFTFDDGSSRNYQLFVPCSPSAQMAGYASFATTVPEPSEIVMVAFGLIACLASTRRSRRSNKRSFI